VAGPAGPALTAAAVAAALLAGAASGETMRVATWSAELSRPGPGLLLRDIVAGDDPQVSAVVSVIDAVRPDILLVTGFDHDPGGATLAAFADALAGAGLDYPHRFALPSNTGLPSGLDLDGDGRLGTARDAHGYGEFRGDGAMALLSRFPIEAGAARDLSALRWADLPGAPQPERADGTPFPSAAAQAARRLSSTGHWIVPVVLPGGARLTLMAFAATPPVFDGPEDANGLRNAAEIGLWQTLLDGTLPEVLGPPPGAPFVILGRANTDPEDGDGRHAAIRALLADPRLQDPRPESPGAAAAADPSHAGDPARDTVEWQGRGLPGNLRVDYVLPSTGLTVRDAGVHWPAGPAETARAAARHRLVWVDIALPAAEPGGRRPTAP
jgi:hypothetical protein